MSLDDLMDRRKAAGLILVGGAALVTGCAAMKDAGKKTNKFFGNLGGKIKEVIPHKKEEAPRSPEENIMLMPTDEFFKKTIPCFLEML